MRKLEIKRTLGGGGFGTIYLAKLVAERGFGRLVAVKVLRRENDHLRSDWRTRLRDEARLMGLLQDEHIVGVLELVAIGERDAVLMDYVEGVDLHRLRGKGIFLPPRVLAEVGAVLAGTLHRMHTAKHPDTDEPLAVVHRDIKPGNIMLTAHGGLRLLDFGVARAAFVTRESVTNDIYMGSEAYWSPEYCQTLEVSPALDIYALGLTLARAASPESLRPSVSNQFRADERVAEFLRGLEGYEPLHPVLRDAVAFDTQDRPTGAELAERFHELAEQLPGPSLRSWAGENVPRAMSQLRHHPSAERETGEFLPGQELEVGDSPIEALTQPPFDTDPAPPEEPSAEEPSAEAQHTPVDSEKVESAEVEPTTAATEEPPRAPAGPLNRFVFFALLGFAITVVVLALMLGD